MLTYLIIGFIIAILLDLLIRYSESSKPLTFLEIWGCTLFWPIVIILTLIGILNNKK